MLTIPEEYAESIQRIIEWHLSTYVPDKMFNIPTKRILERLEQRSVLQLEDKELYYINECVANAKSNVSECGVEQAVVDNIFNWIHTEYAKAKHPQI